MKRGRPPYEDVLTPREWEVLELVERGLTNDEIADHLGVSPSTAKFHVSEILSKLQVSNRREAGAWRLRRVPALLSLLKGGAFLAATAAIGAIIYFGLIGLLLKDSKSGTTQVGKVAYVVDGDVWVKKLPTGPEKKLTKWGDVRGEPQWSASGEWLSVVRDEPYVPPAGASLADTLNQSDTSTWIIDADGKRERQLEHGYVIPSWSPVKDEFLVGAEVQEADGTNRRVLFAANSSLLPGAVSGVWTPSGEWIVATVSPRSTPDAPPTRALFRVRPDGTDEREFYRLEVSECQKRIWVSRTGSCRPSETAEGDERLPLPLSGVLTNTHIVGSIVTPDEALAPLPANPVRAIPLDAANGVLSGGNVSYSNELFTISQASGRIAGIQGSTTGPNALLDWRITLVEPSTGGVKYVTAPGEAATHPAWSPDGRTLFFAAADGSMDSLTADAVLDSRRIWSAEADGGNRRQLTSDPRYRDEYPRATPDGTSVLFTRVDLQSEEDTPSLWLLELATGKLTTVVDDFDQIEHFESSWQRLFDWWQPK